MAEDQIKNIQYKFHPLQNIFYNPSNFLFVVFVI